MQIVDEPQVFFVGKTEIHKPGLEAYLRSIGLEEDDWYPDPRESGAETLFEVGGRLCYRSWAPYDPDKPLATNPNVTKTREGNRKYLSNIVRSAHGAVVEHAGVSFIFRDVSRVLTHEMVRHRAGWAYSQESLRYVRLDDGLRFWVSPLLRSHPNGVSFAERAVSTMEGFQRELHDMFNIKSLTDFGEKKKLTSMFRRFAPIGLATTIMATGNFRAWRHTIALRTSLHAEEEARICYGEAARQLKEHYPNIFFDMNENEDGEWVLENPKI
jgi:thymidylate synthase (FAD)